MTPSVERIRLAEGFEVVAYVYGAGEDTLLMANGGPGLPSLYLRQPHAVLANRGYRVVAWDQLGCGASDRPDDATLWTLERYVAEMEQVRAALNLGRVHLLGHSWGNWICTEYCLTYPDNVKSYIAADGACDIPHLITELHALRQALGPETVEMMLVHERDGTIEHPEYQAAITILNYRHVCRLKDWPDALTTALSDWNMGPYRTIQGPNEFTYTGIMTSWNRIPAMSSIDVPALILCGRFDELTPACSGLMHAAMPNSKFEIFEHSSHMPFYEQPVDYFAVIENFLKLDSGGSR